MLNITLIKLKKKYVINNEAYSLLDALMGLFIISILLLLLAEMIIILKDNYRDNYYERETLAFIENTQQDLLEAKEIINNTNELKLINYKNEEIEYITKNNKLIREKNHQGNEILLYGVKKIQFYNERKTYYFKVEYLNGEEYSNILGGKFEI